MDQVAGKHMERGGRRNSCAARVITFGVAPRAYRFRCSLAQREIFWQVSDHKGITIYLIVVSSSGKSRKTVKL